MTAPSEPPAATQPLIEARDLERRYTRSRRRSVHALRGVSFEIAAGQRFGIVGESGSGKSTLVRLLAALDTPTAGSVSFRGNRIDGVAERGLRFLRSELQIVFQDPMGSLDPRMRVRDIIREPLGRTRRAEHTERVAELLEAVELPADSGQRYPHQFSGGQRQRISIARALAPRPSVLIADEPVSALDVSVRAQILDLLLDLVERLGLTLVFVSHDLNVVRYVCDEVAVMRHGEIVERGPIDRVYAEPAHPYTQQLLAAAPSLRAALARLEEGP
ncbi:MAG: ATP-binding cassette domain-containing protein [Pseudonocardiaceae bacterium]|nr:ATP-binding cassette domain-containing protein [Pseudonocardiaceae bacterium]